MKWMTVLSRDLVLQILFQRVAERHEGAIFLADEVDRWPVGIVTALEAARLIEQGQQAEGLVCTGCSERCYREAHIVEDAGQQTAMSTCELFPNQGPFQYPISRLDRWISTRQKIAQFVAKQAGWKLPQSQGEDIRFRFGTQRFGDKRRAIMLEFEETATLHVGGMQIELSELVEWQSDSPRLDWDALATLARAAPDLQSGGKRELPSSSVQAENKLLTTIRNNRWQRRADQLRKQHPSWNKDRIAQEIGRAPENKKVEWTTIDRVIRLKK
jgi:hypothetical protein